MADYIVSARKYRPATFKSVVGQGALTQTLQNAIGANHLAHAYLFCGPRGVGKTTCARIFAKTINCTHLTTDLEACNECPSCQSFIQRRSLNIRELDAASNNSVDDIRQLIDQIHIPPQLGKYNVYIIDEVHMLSQSAFNALLKTLEEPPSWVIFILATTEKHKIPATILSRCQVFDFARISNKDIVQHLKYVAKEEGIEITEPSLDVIADKAEGGMRDALSIFDQLYAFCGTNISYDQTVKVLNVLDTEYFFKIVQCVLDKNIYEALVILDEILSKGFDGHNFLLGFMHHLRNLLVVKDPKSAYLTDVSPTLQERYISQSNQFKAQPIFDALEIINNCELAYRSSKNKRLTIELCLVKLCRENHVAVDKSTPSQKSPSKADKPSAINDKKDISTPSQTKPTQPTYNAPNTISIHPHPIAKQGDSQIIMENSSEGSLDEARLREVWADLTGLFASDERMVQNIENHLPTLDDKGQVCLVLDNEFQKQDFLSNIDNIKSFLSKGLKVSDVKIIVKVMDKSRVFLSEEAKLEKMISQYPILNQFISRLGLTLDV